MFLTQQGGLLGPFAWVFGKILDLMYNLLADGNGVANLGLCIILFTVVVKVILIPMNVNTSKTSKINSLIQPEIKKIQKKYQNRILETINQLEQAYIKHDNVKVEELSDKLYQEYRKYHMRYILTRKGF